MSNQDLKRSFGTMSSPHPNGTPANGTITTRNQQQQQQQAHTHAQQARMQQQQRIAMMNGNQHGYAHQPHLQKRVYNFVEEPDEILKKFEKSPPSMEFHIHENHYRFGNQDGIISKSNQMVKEFLEYVARGEIPHATVEVLRDAGITFYEGCLILKVFDHRNFIEVEGKRVPRSFRALLRPTQLSLYFDMLYQSDMALQKFSDALATGMETEILMLTNRKLDLKVPLNPYKATPYTKPVAQYPIIKESTGEILHNHREECTDPESKAFHPFKELHEELPQQNSEYEQFMLIMNDKAASDSAEGSQFTRLRFVEQLRLNKEKLKQASINANLSTTNNRSPMGRQSPNNIANLTPAQQQMLQQRRLQQLQLQQMQSMNGNLSPLQQQQQHIQQQKAMAQQQLQQTSPMTDSMMDDKKLKKQKKAPLKKPPQPKPVAGKTLPGTYSDKTLPGASEEPPKKKRGTYKKKPKTEMKP
ncbi:Transcription factor SPT20 [Cyberlindnera fabianii]|uniref:Transcription factor SPT20 n=2 Tax=Cyberlindnera fabianii TaxID=36022 RepID=A0A1V2LC52_CYBFA|nr:Transcription factor SPT20 [Cyberlindnera fabianii]